jgi:polar amino acid transport system substrate-binding protein
MVKNYRVAVMGWIGLWLIIVACGAVRAESQTLAQRNMMHIAYSINSPILAEIPAIIIQAYQSLGYRVTLHDIPLGRALLLSNNGELDGELIRAPAIETYAKNLVRVPQLLLKGSVTLYCQAELVCDAAVLADQRNIVGIVAGVNYASEMMKLQQASIYSVKSLAILEELLRNNRLKYAISLATEGGESTSALDMTQFQSINLAEIEGYHYIHRKHMALLPKLTAAIKQAMLK